MRTGIRQAFLASFLILLVSFGVQPPAGQKIVIAEGLQLDQNRQNPPKLVYPLARRYPMTSLFDHSNPGLLCSDRNGVITIYTGATASDGNQDCPGDDFTGDYYDWGNCVSMVTDCNASIRDLRWSNFEQPGWLYYDRHTGYDFPCSSGTPVVAAASGTTS